MIKIYKNENAIGKGRVHIDISEFVAILSTDITGEGQFIPLEIRIEDIKKNVNRVYDIGIKNIVGKPEYVIRPFNISRNYFPYYKDYNLSSGEGLICRMFYDSNGILYIIVSLILSVEVSGECEVTNYNYSKGDTFAGIMCREIEQFNFLCEKNFQESFENSLIDVKKYFDEKNEQIFQLANIIKNNIILSKEDATKIDSLLFNCNTSNQTLKHLRSISIFDRSILTRFM